MGVNDRLEKERVKLESVVGEPLRAVLPGLAAGGAFSAVVSSTLQTADLWREANANGAGVAGSTFSKNRYGLLALTGAGRTKLWSTSTGWRGTKIESLAGDWGPGEVQIGIAKTGSVMKVAIRAPQTGQAYLLEMMSALGGESIVRAFADATGIAVEVA